MQVLVPLIAQPHLGEPEQENSASSRDLAVPRQLAPTEVVNPPDSIDLPYLEVRNLDDVGPGVGCERYRSIEEHPHDLVQGVELPLEFVPHKEGVLPQFPAEAGWSRVHDCLFIEVGVILDYLLCEGHFSASFIPRVSSISSVVSSLTSLELRSILSISLRLLCP